MGETGGPCLGDQYLLSLVIAFGVVVNTALATWLAHRRRLADVREHGITREHIKQCPFYFEQRQREESNVTHPPGIQP